MATMHAIVQRAYGEGDVFAWQEVERPQPKPGQVLVRVAAAGVNSGDWHLTTGRPYLMRVMGFGLTRPKATIPGLDAVGTVEALGEGVTDFAVGDAVFGVTEGGSGAWADFAVVNSNALMKKPASIDDVTMAASIDSAITAREAVEDVAAVRAGQTVLVIGASGGVGSFAVQFARAAGADVTGVARAAKADFALSLGATHVIDYRTSEITEGDRRYDVILDMAGNRPLSLLRKALAPKGTLVIVGGEEGGVVFGGIDRQLRALMTSPFVDGRLTVHFSAGRTVKEFGKLIDRLEKGDVVARVDRTLPIARAGEALAVLRGGEVRGKVVLTA